MVKNGKSPNRDKKIINDYPIETEKEQITDVTQAREFLKVLSGEIGTIVEQLLGSIYDLEVAESYADSIIRIYKKLLKEGITQQTVEKIITEYSSNIDKIVSAIKKNGD